MTIPQAGVSHVYTPDSRRRVRKYCPYCKHLCYGSLAEYYDGFYMLFDCGARIDSEGWTPPRKGKTI